MKLRLDLHVHTNRSSDARTPPELIPKLVRERGLDGLAITDHNILSHDSSSEIVILPGMEVSSSDGHIIGLGVSEPVSRGLSGDETIRTIREFGGVSIIVHPYDLLRSAVRPHLLEERPDLIEVINSSSFLHTISWRRARKFAHNGGFPTTAGSDSHIPETLGRAYTEIECDSMDPQSILAALKAGRTVPRGTVIGYRERLRKRFS